MKLRHYLPPLLLFIFGVLWILTTDELLARLVGQDLASYKDLQTVKGIVFVVLIALISLWSVRLVVGRSERLVQFYRSLYEQNPYPMWIFDMETKRFLSVNKAALERYGYTQNELKRMTIRDIRPQQEVELLEERLKDLEDDELKYRIWTHQTKGGELLKVKVHGYPIKYQGRSARLVVVSDVTDIENARAREEEYANVLRRREAELDAVVNNTDDLIWSIDRNIRATVLNTAFREFCKQRLDVDLNVGDSVLFDSMSDKDREFWSKMYKTVLGGKDIKFERELINENGESTWLSTSMKPIPGENGKVIGVSCYSRNVSDYKRNIVTLGKQNTRLREIAFISSHELRKPVANILGVTKLLEGNRDKEALLKMITYLQDSAEELDIYLRKIVKKTEEI